MAMVTCPEWISGKGNFIDCMHGGSIPDDVINRYCYIQVDIIKLNFLFFHSSASCRKTGKGLRQRNISNHKNRRHKKSDISPSEKIAKTTLTMARKTMVNDILATF